MRKHEGYTLVEMVVSIAVGLVIIAAIYAVVNVGQRSSVNVERKVAAHQDARASLELMELEIQMASYNPTYATRHLDGSRKLRQRHPVTRATGGSRRRPTRRLPSRRTSAAAAATVIGVVGGSPNEIITYAYDSANQYITRSTNCGGNQPFLGDTPASGRPRAVRVINTAAVPVFRYFDAQGTEITTAGLPAGIPNIARIDITLWVETEDVDANSGQRRRMIYSTSVIPRNHVIK